MLSAADSDLARRDPALPGLGLVLDPDRFAAQLASYRPEVAATGARATYVRYKPRTSCLMSYVVQTGRGARDVFAIARTPGAGPKLAKSRALAGRPRSQGAVCMLEEAAVVVWMFPEDGRLAALARLASATRRDRLLRRCLGGRRDLAGAELSVLRYKPERRFVGRLSTASGKQAVVKAYAPAAFLGARAAHRAFGSRPPLRVGALLGDLPEAGLAVLEWVPGRPLAPVTTAVWAEDVRRAGEALARLHGQRPAGLSPCEPEPRRLRAIADWLALVYPPLATRASVLADELAGLLATLPAVSLPVHGDFHARQVLWSEDSVAILDLDEAGLGDPSGDLGSFVADLERDACAERIPAAAVGAAAEALLEGYARLAARPADRALAARTAAALFRLAPHCFRDREPDWPARTEALVERVDTLLGSARPRRRGAALPSPRAAVLDALAVRDDTGLPAARQALDPALISPKLRRLPVLARRLAGLDLETIRVVRHKPGRRCLIEYAFGAPATGGVERREVVLGKLRARGADTRTARLHADLRARGLCEAGPLGVCVPEPLGVLPDFGLWLQARVSGVPAGNLLIPGDAEVAARLARALRVLHATDVAPDRTFTVADELAILGERLGDLATRRPAWRLRLERMLEGCARLASELPTLRTAVVHRDFHPEQALLDGPRVWLLDLDLCARGDPALDAGNFIAHLVEMGIRIFGHAPALAGPAAVFMEEFLRGAEADSAARVAAYTTLTLARHVELSTRVPGRDPTTGPLLDLCEQRLAVQRRGRPAPHRLLEFAG